MKKIKVLSTGYYDSTNNKVALLKEGEELDVVGETGPVKLVDYKVNCWQCLKDGRYVFVEKENAEVIERCPVQSLARE
jgi:protocatechuate 3,4-dioxygenase beta subunit